MPRKTPNRVDSSYASNLEACGFNVELYQYRHTPLVTHHQITMARLRLAGVAQTLQALDLKENALRQKLEALLKTIPTKTPITLAKLGGVKREFEAKRQTIHNLYALATGDKALTLKARLDKAALYLHTLEECTGLAGQIMACEALYKSELAISNAIQAAFAAVQQEALH